MHPLEAGFPACGGAREPTPARRPLAAVTVTARPRELLLVVVQLAEPLRAAVGDGGRPDALTEPLTSSGAETPSPETQRRQRGALKAEAPGQAPTSVAMAGLGDPRPSGVLW